MASRNREQMDYDEMLFDEVGGLTSLLPGKRSLFLKVWVERMTAQGYRESMALDLDLLVDYYGNKLAAVEKAWLAYDDGHREELQVPDAPEDDAVRQLAIFISAGSILLGGLLIYWSIRRETCSS